MQDIRIGRNLSPSQRTTGIPTIAAPLALMTADANRGRVSVSTLEWSSVNNEVVCIRADSPTGPVLCSLSLARPSLVLTVEEYGTLVTGALFATVAANNAVKVDATDTVWRTKPEDA